MRVNVTSTCRYNRRIRTEITVDFTSISPSRPLPSYCKHMAVRSYIHNIREFESALAASKGRLSQRYQINLSVGLTRDTN